MSGAVVISFPFPKTKPELTEAFRASVEQERAAAFTNMRVALITASHALMRASIEIEQEEAIGHAPGDAAVVARLAAYRTYLALNHALPLPREEDPTIISTCPGA